MSAKVPPSLAEVRAKKWQVLRAMHARGVRNPRVFGSVARGDAVPTSDVDLVVDFAGEAPEGFRYFGLIGELQDELAAILGRPVHVVHVSQSSPAAQRISREAVPL